MAAHLPHRSVPRRLWRARAAALAACCLAATPAPGPAPGRALVVVRTLVMDALGTRTVDTDTARIPFGSRGLLIKRVPYAGPPLSYRVAVLAGPPQEGGIPLTMTSEVWNGDAEVAPPPDQVARREEATVLSAEGSYLLELDHDPQSGRRIVLSLTARPSRPEEENVPVPFDPSGPAIRFVLDVMREAGGRPDPPDQRVMSSFVGQPITYSSGVRLPTRPGAAEPQPEQVVGLSVTLAAERVQGDLVSVRLDLSGAEFVDAQRQRLEPFRHQAIRTVASGTPFDVTVEVPAGEAQPPAGGSGVVTVRYLVRVTPFVLP